MTTPNLYFMSGGNEINLRLRKFPLVFEIANNYYGHMILASIVTGLAFCLSTVFAPTLITVLALLAFIVPASAAIGTGFIRKKNYVKVPATKEAEEDRFWGFEKGGFRDRNDMSRLWYTALSIITDFHDLLLNLDITTNGGSELVKGSLYATEQAFFEVSAKTAQFQRFFQLSEYTSEVSAQLEREFAEVYNLTKKVREGYEAALTYSVKAEASNVALQPTLAVGALDAQQEVIHQGIEILMELDQYNGRNQLPTASEEPVIVEGRMDHETADVYHDVVLNEKRHVSAPPEAFFSKEEVLAQWKAQREKATDSERIRPGKKKEPTLSEIDPEAADKVISDIMEDLERIDEPPLRRDPTKIQTY